ncbi:MAG: deaminase [Firmicutes bacterium]|nr:deaminase [Bacillota bacterium]
MECILTPKDYDFMKLAKEIATKSGCIRGESRFGAIAVKDGNIIAEGWNGHVGNIKPCIEQGSCIRVESGIPSGTRREVAHCICAEQRLICTAAKDGVALENSTMYVNGLPCEVCMRLIKAAGIKRVFHTNDYLNDESYKKAELVGLELVKIDM